MILAIIFLNPLEILTFFTTSSSVGSVVASSVGLVVVSEVGSVVRSEVGSVTGSEVNSDYLVDFWTSWYDLVTFLTLLNRNFESSSSDCRCSKISCKFSRCYAQVVPNSSSACFLNSSGVSKCYLVFRNLNRCKSW